jgi:antitoxin component of MazEF toxin-antitoxin module
MIKTITKIGNSHGIIFDTPLMDLAHLKPGDQVNVEVHSGGTLTITPLQAVAIEPDVAAATARRLIKKNAALFRRLA